MAADRKKCILVAEDILSNYLLVAAFLKKQYMLIHALNGAEAVEIVRTQVVDLILMDMKMPVMGGLEATAEIRKFNQKIPIVALTAHAFEADKAIALEAGCNDYMVKPVDRIGLLTTLERFLG